jgi:Mrp family chromosome partitioning ATPase
MSALDQAFIKAFRRGADQRRRSDAAPVDWHNLQAGAPSSIAINQPHTIPPAHTRFTVATTVVEAVETPDLDEVQRAATARERAEAVASATPLPHGRGSFRAGTAIEPAFQVPHFVWPAMVDELMTHSAGACSRCGAVLVDRSAQQRKVVLVAASARGVGCSTVSLVLARAAAMRGARVAIIDADVRQPLLAELLGMHSPVSWDQSVSREEAIEESLIESVLERLTLMPLVPSGLSMLPNMAGAIEALRGDYDLIFVDAGPLDDDAAAVNLAAALRGATIDDGVIVRDNEPEQTSFTRRLAALGIARWELVENFLRSG